MEREGEAGDGRRAFRRVVRSGRSESLDWEERNRCFEAMDEAIR